MKNPLNKRMLRELHSEMGKYAVIAILLIATIGFVSGFLVAGSSMMPPTTRALRNTTSRMATSAWKSSSTAPSLRRSPAQV